MEQEIEKGNDKERNGPNPFELGSSGPSEAQLAVSKEERAIEDTSLHTKKTMQQSTVGLRREEAKVEEEALPSSKGDSVMYGESVDELAGEIVSPAQLSKKKLAHAAADAKAFAKVA